MNKAELAAEVAGRVQGTDADARAYVDAVFDVIMSQVAAGERVQVLGFGTFDGVQRAARAGRNPRTGAAIQIAASVSPRFQAGQTFRAQVAEANGVVKEDVVEKVKAKKDKAADKKSAKTVKEPKAKAKTAPSKKASKPAKTKKAAKAAKPGKK
ncbi:MAG: HU family DNA-binding protein [Catenulispora sp.]|nr:HU family DNA-binding protein [Catenulispora sp.]